MKASRSTEASPRKRAAAESDPSLAGVRSAEVVLDVEVEHHRVHLVLANCGDAVATDVQVKFSRDLAGLGGSLNVSTLPVFTRLGVPAARACTPDLLGRNTGSPRSARDDRPICRNRLVERTVTPAPER